ncbi:hypothetical protein OG21DRAFT_1070618 [Imleria badia]|nr:hypothetical protein OG21DRAFT_1070618 [Imleria badia]
MGHSSTDQLPSCLGQIHIRLPWLFSNFRLELELIVWIMIFTSDGCICLKVIVTRSCCQPQKLYNALSGAVHGRRMIYVTNSNTNPHGKARDNRTHAKHTSPAAQQNMPKNEIAQVAQTTSTVRTCEQDES